MQKLNVKPSSFAGRVNIPPSKSFAHRALLCAALCGGNVNISNFSTSRDMQATENFLTALGMAGEHDGKSVFIRKTGEINTSSCEVDCIESGSTLRFVIPIAAALGMDVTLTGSGRLPERPLGIYTELLPKHGVNIECLREGYSLPMHVSGKLTPGEFSLPGNVSSQFITGLMYALPLLDGDSKIIITTELESESYLDITMSVLSVYGIKIEHTDYGYFVPGNQTYKAVDYTVEGDWSQAAFFLTMGAFSKKGISISGLNPESVQGDRKVLDIYSAMGLNIEYKADELYVNNPNADKEYLGLKGVSFNASDIPDAVPAISAALCLCEGESHVTGAARLRIKECDRLMAVHEALKNLGADIEELSDGLIIKGVKSIKGGEVNAFNDHRILMSTACLAAKAHGEISISDPHCVNKSYPDFYKDYNSLGGKADVIELG
ncbi:MAG: 3-phosphoshikimate 1-carboxyvinyltransferase [Clostridia bacterium]|nr:3-phosphoshikimate 1-carboxyvinyltransferase [Clostridia bacterium]